MEYLYFKSDKGNFGDDLNPWLWPKLIQSVGWEDTVFLGIGSILYNENPNLKVVTDKKKIVFGAGIRPSTKYKTFKYDETWDIRFLRGPLSAASFNGRFKFLADAAYAVRLTPDFSSYLNRRKKYNISLMPYFRSMDVFDWRKICNELGYHLISPYSENGVEFTLSEIASSKYLISEAMHGAILADALRVPWHRYVLSTPYTEGSMISEFKWMDWLHSINCGAVDSSLIPYYRNTFINKWVKKISLDTINSQFLVRKKTISDIYNQLSVPKDYFLSKDNLLNQVDEKFSEEISILNSITLR